MDRAAGKSDQGATRSDEEERRGTPIFGSRLGVLRIGAVVYVHTKFGYDIETRENRVATERADVAAAMFGAAGDATIS